MPIVVDQVDAPTDDARALIGELDAELNGPYAPEQRHGFTIERLFRPGVLFYIARLDGEAVGCGGIAFDANPGDGGGFAEVKRMYVRPSSRGCNVAQALLARLEQEARGRGVTRVALETGDAQHAALRLYERAGFTRRAAFGTYASMPPHATERSIFFEKHLAD